MTLTKTFRTAIAALTLAGATVAISAPASAQYYYKNRGGISPGAAAAVGVVGGLALGAAIAGSRPAYGVVQPYGYAPPPPPPPAAYYAPPRRVYVQEEPECVVRRQRVWVEGWGWDTRRVRICAGDGY